MPTVANVAPLQTLLSRLTPGEPLRSGALTCIPLYAPAQDEPDWLTLEAAMETAVVTEVNEAGVVPALTVTNRAAQPLLLLDGEELVGAKQNRVLNTTVLVAARSRLTIPVSCVEQGRWQRRSDRFTPSHDALLASLRARKVARVSESLRAGRGHQGDQGEIWAALRAEAEVRGVASPTGAMADIYARHREQIDAARAVLAARPGQVGVLVYRSGQWLGLDVLAAPGLFARAWPRLCAGYAADAVAAHETDLQPPHPSEALDRLFLATATPAPAVGLGLEYRLAADRLTGSALVVDDRVAHLMAFALPAGGDR